MFEMAWNVSCQSLEMDELVAPVERKGFLLFRCPCSRILNECMENSDAVLSIWGNVFIFANWKYVVRRNFFAACVGC
jgi:hypothetical protein